MGKHAIVIFTYNERENLCELVSGIVGLGLGTKIIGVDDNSPDGTGELADALQSKHGQMQVILTDAC